MGNSFASGLIGNIVGGPTISLPEVPEVTQFNIDVQDTLANILARSGDAVGVIAFGTDTFDIYVFDGTTWQTYEND